MKFFSKEMKELAAYYINDLKLSPKDVAGKMQLSINEVNWLDIVVNKKFNYTESGRGRPELQPWLIATRDKFTTARWDNTEPKIAKARELYDAGLVEMVHGYDGVNILLYAIPRRHPELERKAYFSYLPTEKETTDE